MAVIEHVVQVRDQTTAPLKAAAASSREYANATKSAEQATKGMSNATRALAVQVPDVVSQISAGVPPMQVFTQQGLQVVQQMGAMGVSLGVAGTAALALGAAVGAGAIAWAAYNEDADRADRISASLADSMDDLAAISDKTATAVLLLRNEIGDLSDEALALEQNAIRAFEGFNRAIEETKQKQAALREEQSSLKTVLVDTAEATLDTLDVAGLYSAALDGLTTNSEELQEEIDSLNTVYDEAARLTGEQVLATEALISKRAENAEATRRERDEQRGLTAAMREAERAAAAAARAEQAAADEARRDLDIAIEFKRQALRERQAQLAAEERAKVEAERAAVEERRRLMAEQIQREAQARRDLAAGIGGAAGVGQAVGTGDLIGLAGSLGAVSPDPVVGAALTAVSTSLSVLEQIGREGPDAIVQQVRDQTEAIVAGLEALDELIPELAAAFAEAAPAIVEALVANAPAILEAVVMALSDIRTELPLNIAAAILSAFGLDGAADRLTGAADKLGGFNRKALGSLFGAGDAAASGKLSTGGAITNINISGAIASDVDALADRLRERFDRGGVLGRFA